MEVDPNNCVELFWFTYMKVFSWWEKQPPRHFQAFFKMMGKQSSPGSWRIETVGKRNSHGRRYVGIARLEVQVPGHEDETIGLYIDSSVWQGVSFGCLSIAILIFISTVIKLSYCHHRHIVISITLSSSSHHCHHYHIVIIITSSSSSHRHHHHIVIIITHQEGKAWLQVEDSSTCLASCCPYPLCSGSHQRLQCCESTCKNWQFTFVKITTTSWIMRPGLHLKFPAHDGDHEGEGLGEGRW